MPPARSFWIAAYGAISSLPANPIEKKPLYHFYPAYRFDAPRTPVRALERAWATGKKAGLRFVYVGNVAGHRLEHTTCPACGKVLIARRGLSVVRCQLDQACCPECGCRVPGVCG
jgi:pyruvate formate lyase activating enzyme